MKTITATIPLLALMLFMGQARAQNSVNLAWDANPPEDAVTGYKLYQRITVPPVAPATEPTTSWKLLGQTAADKTEFIIPRVTGGDNIYAVSAFNAKKEGDKSTELTVTIISAVKGLRIKVATIAVTP